MNVYKAASRIRLLLGRIYAKRLPKKLMLLYPYSCHPNTIRLISCRLTIFLSYSNHPDNLLTVAW